MREGAADRYLATARRPDASWASRPALAARSDELPLFAPLSGRGQRPARERGLRTRGPVAYAGPRGLARWEGALLALPGSLERANRAREPSMSSASCG